VLTRSRATSSTRSLPVLVSVGEKLRDFECPSDGHGDPQDGTCDDLHVQYLERVNILIGKAEKGIEEGTSYEEYKKLFDEHLELSNDVDAFVGE
jgi:hypothetical protein